jgi:hypothetical protein
VDDEEGPICKCGKGCCGAMGNGGKMTDVD